MFFAACYECFNRVDSLEFNKTKMTESYLKIFNNQFTNPIQTIKKHKRIKRYFFIKYRLNLIYKCILYNDCRLWLLNLLIEKEFYTRRLEKLKYLR